MRPCSVPDLDAIFTPETPTRPLPRTAKRSTVKRHKMPAQAAYVKKRQFLQALITYGTRYAATSHVGIAYGTPDQWKHRDKLFAAEWAETEEYVTQRLESSTYQRALDKSDTLAMFLLRSRRPGVYGDLTKQGGITIDQRQQVAVQTTEFNVDALADSDLASLKANVAKLLEKAREQAALNTKPTLQIEGRK